MSTIATSIVHFPQGSFIGGGYNPDEQEAYFLTRPEFETVPLSTPDTETRIYRQISAQLTAMDGYPAKLNTATYCLSGRRSHRPFFTPVMTSHRAGPEVLSCTPVSR